MRTLEELLRSSRMFDLFVHVIANTPHASGNENLLVSTLAQWAESNGFDARIDATGNIGILVPGRGKYAGTNRALLCQCHIDMVANVAAGVQHDFATDPIKVRLLDDGWLYGTDTTLGADNGLGVACMMAAAEDKSLECAPFIVVCTVREESDMGGAQNLNPFITFQDQVELVGGLNLDSEEGETDVFIGCAGGTRITSVVQHMPHQTALSETGYTGFSLFFNAFSGGHSGLEIDKCHQNAVRVVARFLSLCARYSFVLCDGQGGNKMNSIPTSCQIRGYMDTAEFVRLQALFPSFVATLRGEIVPDDSKFQAVFQEVNPIHLPNSFWSVEESDQLVKFLYLVPDGQLATDQIVDYKLPRTSTNLGVFNLTLDTCEVTFLVRSSVNSERDLTVARICQLGDLLGFTSKPDEAFPCWQPDANNKVLLAAEKLWLEAFGCPLQRKVTHGGLECGELGKRLGGLPMISFGGHIKRAHETDEHASVESWLKVELGFKYLLCNLVDAMSV